MLVGCPKEIKSQEHRVGLVPSSVVELVANGHEVIVETNAGAAINFSDDDYRKAGAEICDTPDEIFERCDMVVKVKEPQKSEYTKLREGQILFTYLHLAPDPDQAQGLMDSGCVAIAYETVTNRDGRGLPLLAPMSEVAGRLSALMGANYLQKHHGGNGRLVCGVPGVLPAKFLVIGGGVSGFNAARVAVGMGADVTILEKNPDRLRYLDDYFHGQAKVIYSNLDMMERFAAESDVVIGAVLIPGAAAPKLITKEMLPQIANGTVMVDIAIDQGGCFETSRPTTHQDPTYDVDGKLHYCVANMPGAVPLSSALALNHAVLPYAVNIANHGWKKACANDPGLANGLNVSFGTVNHAEVAEALDLPYKEVTL
ncbi:MAG: alanine dehydrogenase [Alphaproteobacteria bacterium]|jgi:alanine dehydrogenase|nr:alanine dehydrogenase [Alphaproteobacteria bacterium]MDP7222765.1 alanine dehydrogenase [Alphaproteobacteria bacterium]